MDPVTFSRRIAKLEYEAVRWPFTVLDHRVITRYWERDALLRSGFQRFLGSLDRFAGWLLADDAISQRGQDLLRQTQDTRPAPEPAAEHLAPEDQTAEEPAAGEPAAAEPAAMEAVPREAAIDEPPTEELTLAELAGPAVRDQAAEPLATPAEPATVGTVDVTFTLPGEVGAGDVALCGDFNNWTAGNIALNRGGDGSWQTTVPLEPGHSYRYRYLLDGERWENAWQADRYEPNPFGSTNSVVIVGSPELALMSYLPAA
jgi:Glycogen recognition site of AMP-activated protein kinase